MITALDQVSESRLTWPETKPRSVNRGDSAFKSRELRTEENRVEAEFGRWGIRKLIISRNNQRIYAGDPGVAVWWEDGGKALRVLACDRFAKLADNVHAIFLTLEAMRGLERWGAYTAEQAAEGARLALPPPDAVPAVDWKTLLGDISGHPALTPAKRLVLAENTYRLMSKEGAGDEAKQRSLNLAIEAARKELAP